MLTADVQKLGPNIWQNMVLRKLGKDYGEFFRYLGLTPEEIQRAELNHNRNISEAIAELFNRLV